MNPTINSSANTLGHVLPDLRCDVLIIGGGIAGAWCALKLARRGLKAVMIVYKGRTRGGVQGSTVRSVGAINTAPLSEADFESYLNRIGRGQVNPTIAPIMQGRLAEELAELEHFCPLSPIRIGVKPECDSRSLLERIVSAFGESGGLVVDGWVTRLVADAHECQGVQYESEDGIGRILAPHLVIASGGYASLLGQSVQTGNFGAMAGQFLRAGGSLANLEFVFQHGFGQPDQGSLTPTEELQGAAIVNRQGEHVVWLERAFFDGLGTQQHQRAAEFWRSHRQEPFFVQMGYRELYQTVARFNAALAQRDLNAAIDSGRELIARFPAQARDEVQREVTLALKESRPFDYDAYARMRAWYPAPAGPQQRIRHIPYFSMGGMAHNGCRTSLHNVYVTGEAMHDFGADRVGGLPWGLYLCCGGHITDRILSDRRRMGTGSHARPFALVHARSCFDEERLKNVRDILHGQLEERFTVEGAERAIRELRALRRELSRDIQTLHDAVNWSILAEAILVSILARQESRGCFFRNDFPNEDAGMEGAFTFTYYIPGVDQVTASVVRAEDYTAGIPGTTQKEYDYVYA